MSEEQKVREFWYNGQKVADDPGEEYSIDDVKQSLTSYFPELAQASHSSETLEDGTEKITFAKRAGTKGWRDGQGN